MNYPRILLVSSSVFNPYSGGGIMLTNLFLGWPREKIAVIHSDRIAHDERVCEKFYKLKKTLPSIFYRRVLHREYVSSKLLKWIKAYNPEIIYTLLGSLSYIRLIGDLARKFSIPMAIHMMDDWPSVLYHKQQQLQKQMQQEFKELIKQASLRMAICENMSRAYEKRYGYPFLPFHNALDVSKWIKYTRGQWAAGKPFRIVYAGTILPDSQLFSLKDVCIAVAALYSEGLNIRLELHCPFYTHKYRAELESLPSVEMFNAPQEENIAALFGGADLLLLPVNFDEKSVEYIRYSMPNKVPAYLISGTPVLVYGPANVASVQYAQEKKWGHVVAEKSQEKLKSAIRLLVKEATLRENIGKRAYKLALQNHDADKVRRAFHRALIKCVG